MSQNKVGIHSSWLDYLSDEFNKPYMQKLKQFLLDEATANKVIYPSGSEIFAAFNETHFDEVKAVIIGQDPYHGPGQAHGMCFSVKPGVKPPPSLQNIYKEIHDDLGLSIPHHGYLINWAQQGVLLLNSVLTVEKKKPASHQGKGWEEFTDRVIQVLNSKKQNLVFMLWGAPAQKKGSVIDKSKHLVLQCPHPSPFSAHRGFLGCRHFSQSNAYLTNHGIQPIDWKIPEL